MVDSSACGENYGGVILNVDFLLSEFPGGKAFHFDEGAEHKFHIIALGNVVVR